MSPKYLIRAQLVTKSVACIEEYIHCAATTSKEKKVIKFLEQDGRRLMDRAQNCLTVVCELLEEHKDRPGRLTV
jgi:hypothetical protein